MQSGVVLRSDPRFQVPIILTFEFVPSSPVVFPGATPLVRQTTLQPPPGGRQPGATLHQSWQAVSAALPPATTALVPLNIFVQYQGDPPWDRHVFPRLLEFRTP